ncbi:MAG: DUF6094 domain-containing protein [Gammaproteobacteria bacterium]
MPLMFQRLARNFIKNGYFPTDADTTQRVLQALAPHPVGEPRILDPCCGEGIALAETKHHLDAQRCTAYGVEYDEERAWHAKTLLDHCIHGDLQDCMLGRRQFGLLWLNPPYGDLVTDRQGVREAQGGRKRLEKIFYQHSSPCLQYGGILVLILPAYSLDRELAGWIATHFDRVRVFRAAVDTFQQLVVLGRRRRADGTDSSLRARLEAYGVGDAQAEPLPEVWTGDMYTVPAAPPGDVRFVAGRLDPRQLADELRRYPCLWDQFELRFARIERNHRRPLRALSRWHLALALAAGQVSGVVTSRDGRRFVVKGDTHKEKTTRVEIEETDDGAVRETRILTDRFVPVIRAIDFTPGSASFGQVITIR